MAWNVTSGKFKSDDDDFNVDDKGQDEVLGCHFLLFHIDGGRSS